MTKIYEALERLENQYSNRAKQNESELAQQAGTVETKRYEVLHPVSVPGGRERNTRHMRRIYSGMLFRIESALKDKEAGKVIQIVGSRAGEGTSTVARILTETAVRDFGRNTLLIDMGCMGDIQFSHFADTGACALPDGEEDRCETRRITRKWNTLHMPSLTDSNMTWTSSSEREFCPTALDRFRNDYDMIVIDSPPIECNQANPFFPLSDAVVLVVEAERTKHQVVRHSKESIQRQGGNLIGIVLNKKKFHIPDWLYKKI